MKIRHRHLSGRREKKFAILQAVHVLLKFRQLRRADHALAPHQKRRADLLVPVLARVQIEHEINQRAFQSRARARETDESAPAQFRRALQIEKFQLRAERDVIQHDSAQRRLFSPTSHHRILARVFAHRRIRVRQIWNLEKQSLPLLVRRRGLLVQERNLLADFPHLRFEFVGRFPAPAFPADLLA